MPTHDTILEELRKKRNLFTEQGIPFDDATMRATFEVVSEMLATPPVPGAEHISLTSTEPYTRGWNDALTFLLKEARQRFELGHFETMHEVIERCRLVDSGALPDEISNRRAPHPGPTSQAAVLAAVPSGDEITTLINRLRDAANDKDNYPRMDSERWLPVGLARSAADMLEKLHTKR